MPLVILGVLFAFALLYACVTAEERVLAKVAKSRKR